MASGPSDPRSPDDPPARDADDPDGPPRIRHEPPGPADDRARGVPLGSPWGSPPFAAPTPDEESPEVPKGRRPYSSPTAEPETDQRRRPRRIVERPDKLVATGLPRQDPEPSNEPAEPEVRPLRWGDGPQAIPVEPEIPTEPEHVPEQVTDDGEEPVRRVGRPPAGRPTRPDLLVATGPERPGRHHRSPAPAAVRRSSPVRRRRRLLAPIAIVLVLAVAVSAGILVWRWWQPQQAEAGLRITGGTQRSGDKLFTIPAAGVGSNQKLNDMAAVGDAVVAVGSDTTSPTSRPLFLFSPDSGKTWQLGSVSASTTDIVQQVVGGDGLWLASGGDAVGAEHGLWTSTDGFSWSAVEQAGLAAFRKGDLINDIARTASGFVAVGRTTKQDGSAGPAAWQSPDGRAWERVDSRELGVGEIKTVVAKGDVAVAVAQPSDGAGSRVVRSADGGKSWTATGFQLPEAQPRAGSLAVLPEQFVLVPTRTRTAAGDVHVYCSATGADWGLCGTVGGLPAQSTGVETLVSFANGIAAVTRAGLDKYAVLASVDGKTWTKRNDLDKLSGATLRGFTIADSGTLFAGGDQAASDVDNRAVLVSAASGRPAVRVALDGVEGLSRQARDAARLLFAKSRYVAVGSVSGDAGIWTSQNGEDWRATPLGGPRQQMLSDVAYGKRGWLAVGADMTDVSITQPLIATSGDARSWKKLAASGPLARADDHPYLAAHAVAAGPRGYVVAGEDRGPSGAAEAVLWFTPDLATFNRAKKLPQGGAGVRVHDVVAAAPGYVAVGGSGTGDEESGIVWVSKDGVNWTARKRVAPADATSAGLRQIVAYGERLVAVGTAQIGGSRKAFAAISDDEGVSWQTAVLPADQAAAVYDLAATKQGIVAVGWHGTPGSGDSAAWTSQDGLAWSRQDLSGERLGGEGQQWLTAVSVSGTQVVGLGRSTTYSADHLILWTSTLTADR